MFSSFKRDTISAMAVVPKTMYKPVVMSGPSGSGKSTLLKLLMDDFPNYFAFSVSHTTRNPRPGEENGKDYHFVSRAEMTEAIANNDFIEHAEFSANLYGTSKQAVENVIKTGKICILDIDMQGVKSIKTTDIDARYIFIKPPNEDILEERLRARGTETEETLRRRMETAKEALEYVCALNSNCIDEDCAQYKHRRLDRILMVVNVYQYSRINMIFSATGVELKKKMYMIT